MNIFISWGDIKVTQECKAGVLLELIIEPSIERFQPTELIRKFIAIR